VARFPTIKEKLRSTLLNLVAKERDGEVVDRIAIKNACDMLVGLGIDTLDVYVDDFENSFLGESAEFYKVNHKQLFFKIFGGNFCFKRQR